MSSPGAGCPQRLFVHTPGGYGTSDLAKTLVRKVPTGTARNWATVTKLLALLDA